MRSERWQVHMCIMRALAEDEDKADREERRLDLALLDAITWPEYVWEWLRLVGELPPDWPPDSHRQPTRHLYGRAMHSHIDWISAVGGR